MVAGRIAMRRVPRWQLVPVPRELRTTLHAPPAVGQSIPAIKNAELPFRLHARWEPLKVEAIMCSTKQSALASTSTLSGAVAYRQFVRLCKQPSCGSSCISPAPACIPAVGLQKLLNRLRLAICQQLPHFTYCVSLELRSCRAMFKNTSLWHLFWTMSGPEVVFLSGR